MAKPQFQPSPTVPLKFHKAWNYVLLPLLAVYNIITFIQFLINATGGDVESVFSMAFSLNTAFGDAMTLSVVITGIFSVVMIVLEVLAIVGMLKWKGWGYTCNKVHQIIYIVSWAILTAVCVISSILMGMASSSITSQYSSAYLEEAMGSIAVVFVLLIVICVVCLVLFILINRYYNRRKLLFKGTPNQGDILRGAAAGYQNAAQQGYGAYQPQQGQPYAYVPNDQVQTVPMAGNAAAPQAYFCNKCGATLPSPDAKFCPKCGNKING